MPSASDIVTIIDHPLAADRLRLLRDESTSTTDFRHAMANLSDFLVYEATRDLAMREVTVRTPLTETSGSEIAEPPVVVPILRAGLGMLHATQRVLPDAPVGFLGLKRNEETLQPDAYMSTVPDDLRGRRVLVLDPMLATGGSLINALERLVEHNAGPMVAVCVLAAPEGVEAVAERGFDVHVVTAAVDDHLDEDGFIVPGLGDAGDRQPGSASRRGSRRCSRDQRERSWPRTAPLTKASSGPARSVWRFT